MKIGIITWHYYNNFGSHLQAFALCLYLKKNGYNSEIINYRNPKFGVLSPLKRVLLDILLLLPSFVRNRLNGHLYYASYLFEKKYLPQTKPFTERNELSNECLKYDGIICGSDQIWAPNVYNPIYMLDFVPDSINKVSYAASIGLDSIPHEMVENYKNYIGRINHVSVREEKGKEILKNQCGIESTVVLDPTLLLRKEEWDKLKKKSAIKEKYIFCYFLKKDHQYKKLVKEFAEKNGYEIYGVSDSPNDNTWMKTFNYRDVGPCEFIGLIEGSKGVFTDSYHGTIFSMIYHKPFTLFERFSCGDKICQNSRIEQLKDYFGIRDNVVRVESVKSIGLKNIDYDSFEKTLAGLRDKSMDFLEKALN